MSTFPKGTRRTNIVLAKRHDLKQRKPETCTRQNRIDDLEPFESWVLIAVNLQNNIHMPDMEEWSKWLTIDIQSYVLSSNTTIEASFQESSSLLLVTLPVEFWTIPPAGWEACTFISLGKPNIIVPQPATTLSTP